MLTKDTPWVRVLPCVYAIVVYSLVMTVVGLFLVRTVYAYASVAFTSSAVGLTTINAEIHGDQCGVSKATIGGVVFTSRGGTPNGTIYLDLANASLQAELNGTPIKGKLTHESPLSTVSKVVLIPDGNLEITKADVVKITVTAAQIKAAGSAGVTISITSPGNTAAMECWWDSVENKRDIQFTGAKPVSDSQNSFVPATRQTTKPTPSAILNVSQTLLPASPSIAATISPYQKSETYSQSNSPFLTNFLSRLLAFLKSLLPR